MPNNSDIFLPNNLPLRLEKIFHILTNLNPHPKTELNFTNHFTLLIAIILSAQTTDKMVNKATEELFKIASSPSEFLDLGIDQIIQYIKCLGLYKTKANNVIATCKILKEQFNSIVPNNFNDLISLPGVGRKTANVFLNCAFNLPTMGIDTHIARLGLRLGIVSEKDNILTLEKKLIKNISTKFIRNAHHHLILQGRYTCKAKTPLCQQCPIYQYCPSYKT